MASVHPYGAITRGERGEALADMEAMAPFVAGFSDDGRGRKPRLSKMNMNINETGKHGGMMEINDGGAGGVQPSRAGR